MISVDCFACRSKISAPDHAAGGSGKCPKCGALILFPSQGLSIQASPPPESTPDPQPEAKLPKRKKKKFAKKEASRLPVYMACGTLGIVAVFGIATWAGMSFYLEHHRSRQVEEQDNAEVKRKKTQEDRRNSFLEEKQRLDEANLKLRQQKQDKDQTAFAELERQNREIKQKKDLAAEQAAKEFKERTEREAKEIQDKEKALEQEKRRETDRKRQLAMIEEDHRTILAYGKIHIKTAIKDMLWSPPLRATSSKNKKEGLLYRLQGVVGQSRKPVSYYFLVVNREVVAHQQAKDSSAVTIGEIIGDLEMP